MKLNKVRVRGFQSFGDSGDIEFEDGINLIVGQNNAGKSALLRALQLTYPDDRHRTATLWRTEQLPIPSVLMDIRVSGLELRDETLRAGQQRIPVPNGSDSAAFINDM